MSLNLHRISADQQLVLELLSVLYVPVPPSRLLIAVEAYRGRPWSLAELRDVFAVLKDKYALTGTHQGRYHCAAWVVEIVTRRAAGAGRLEALVRAATTWPSETAPGYSLDARRAVKRGFENGPGDYVHRELRLAMHRHDVPTFLKHWPKLNRRWTPGFPKDCTHPLKRVCLSPFEAEWMDALPTPIVDLLLDELAALDSSEEPCWDWLADRLIARPDDRRDQARASLAWRSALQGRLATAEALLPTPGMRAALETMRGRYREAVGDFSAATASLRHICGRKNATLESEFALLYIPALLACGKLDEAERLADLIAKNAKHPLAAAHKPLQWIVRLVRGQHLTVRAASVCPLGPGLAGLLSAAAQVWGGGQQLQQRLERCYHEELAAGRRWLAAEYAQLLARCAPRGQWQRLASELHAACGTVTLMNLVKVVEPWEKLLAGLEGSLSAPASIASGASQRLIWQLSFSHPGGGELGVGLTPKEQKLAADGSGWTSGRPVALTRLRSHPPDFLTQADRGICACIQSYTTGGYYGETVVEIDVPAALPYLVGHPLVFRDADPPTRLQVRAGRPALIVRAVGDDLQLTLEPKCKPGCRVVCTVDADVLTVYQLNASDLTLVEQLQDDARVPPAGRQRLSAVLDRLCAQIDVRWPQGDEVRQLCYAKPPDALAEALLACLAG